VEAGCKVNSGHFEGVSHFEVLDYLVMNNKSIFNNWFQQSLAISWFGWLALTGKIRSWIVKPTTQDVKRLCANRTAATQNFQRQQKHLLDDKPLNSHNDQKFDPKSKFFEIPVW